MGQDRWPLPFFTASIVVGPAPSSPHRATVLFRHSAPVSPSLGPSLSRPPSTPLPPGPAGRPGSLSDRRCHKPSYISPRVTKLRDAGDKVASAGGRSRRITSLAVCLSLILAAVWKSDCQPSQAVRAPPPPPPSSTSPPALSTILDLDSAAHAASSPELLKPSSAASVRTAASREGPKPLHFVPESKFFFQDPAPSVIN